MVKEKEGVGEDGILLRWPLLVFFGRIMKQQARSVPLLFVVHPANRREVWWGWARKARRNLANTWPQTSSSTDILVQGWGIVGDEAAEIGASRKVGTLFGQSCSLLVGRYRCTLYSMKQKLMLPIMLSSVEESCSPNYVVFLYF